MIFISTYPWYNYVGGPVRYDAIDGIVDTFRVFREVCKCWEGWQVFANYFYLLRWAVREAKTPFHWFQVIINLKNKREFTIVFINSLPSKLGMMH